MPSMNIRRRKRVLRSDPWIEHGAAVSGNNNTGYWRGRVTIEGAQMTESEGHPWKPRQRFTGEDVGGDFYTIKHLYGDERGRVSNVQPQWNLRAEAPNDTRNRYYGPLFPVQPLITKGTPHNSIEVTLPAKCWPPDLSHPDSVLDAYGTSAIAMCKPTTSPANLAVGLGELFKEGLPSLMGTQAWQGRAKGARANTNSVGGEYLNVQFGWLPLVSEIKSTASALANAEDLMNQYERDSGRLVRRRYDFPLVRETTVEDVSNGGYNTSALDVWLPRRVAWGSFYGPENSWNRTLVREREITRKIWFSGAFTYHLPADYYSRGKVGQAAFFAKQMLGLELTPEVLWNLAPWSWAADWVTNIGDVLANVSDFASDGLVMPYGYLMETTIISDTYSLHGAQMKGYPKGPISSTFTTVVKKRRKATPFGFGFDMGSLTSRQAAIIAALGLSRV